MIIKGKSRAGPKGLAAHLGNAEKNENVTLLETRGTVAQDLRGALIEMDTYALGTKCQKSLYHAAISPEPPHRLSPEQRTEAIDALEEKLGLSGHARAVVMHEKLGREHIHVVWSRIDLEKMRSVSDSHNYRKHEEVARDLERRFGHERVQGAHHEREGVERPDRTPSRAELRQEERTGISGKQVKLEVTEAFRASDGPEAFQAALEDKGYILAQGDRRDFVIVDRAGGIHSLARRLDGMKAAELREFMSPLDRSALPTAEQAKGTQFDREHALPSDYDREKWDDALAASAIEKDRETAKKVAEENARRKKELLESREDAGVEKSYARAENYVSQATAAQKDFERRHDGLAEQLRPQHPDHHPQHSVTKDFDAAAQLAVPRDRAQITELHNGDWISLDTPIGELNQRFDFNEQARDRYDRMKSFLYSEGDYARTDDEKRAKFIKDRDAQLSKNKSKEEWAEPLNEKRQNFNYTDWADERYRGMERLLNSTHWDESSISQDQRNDPQGYGHFPLGMDALNIAPEIDLRKAADEEERQQHKRDAENNREIQGASYSFGGKIGDGGKTGNIEITDRMARLLGASDSDERDHNREYDDDRGHDRQHEAPGGGRTRSR